jgi:site-specific recombinase XerD
MRIKIIIKYAVDCGKIDNNPINEIKTPQPYNTNLLHLNSDWVTKFYEFDFHSETLSKVRDMYVFSCETGISYADIIKLKPVNIKAGEDKQGKEFEFITDNRQKTKTEYNTIITRRAKEIIDKYGGIDKMPKISNQKCNQYLKDALDILEYPNFKKITFHSARKSFAHNFMNGELDVTEIDMSNMLGHKDLRELYAYGIKDKKKMLSKYV